ncbi:hypothetical protein JQ617_10000 [Bradyrhizobium sp. KB893862 SZCCT0404]|uniref:relaxase/mobilization nuclease domain-containing protein n=1 Tax=Bradyrhizobium sp. KB893862 SZCCT0404 TaxID=2807672 RepID=UPI001BA6F173|nr:hypothetical protein [Bradyrhizobium sp. KB893862 SZCCT0404]MBR1174285.1 hypothetical protein [Bradyrhizobium sp. KB893862 SZCCT0404]
MIARAFSYRGSLTDARRLDAHLWKEKDQRPVLVETRNLCVRQTVEGMQVMAALTAASHAEIAFWHLYVSPRKTLTAAEAAKVVDLVVTELAAHDHPMMVFAHHDKPRAGGGANHLHLVIGHVSPRTFRALDMRHHAPRLHKVMALAAYLIEGEAVPSRWQKSIVEALRADGHGHVADWLIDELGVVPVIKAPRMTDSMRRAAQAADFPLAGFQPGLERLWKSPATEAEIAAFLERNGVAVGRGNTANVIAFRYENLFVGSLHRILRQDASTVHQEAQRRIPGLLDSGESVAPDAAPSCAPRELLRPSDAERQARLDLQKRIDAVEGQLAGLKTKRLSLIYRPGHAGSRDRKSQEAVAARIHRLARAESILDEAISLLWRDAGWMARSDLELMQAAEQIVTSAEQDISLGHSDVEITQDEKVEQAPAPGLGP